MSDKWLLRGAVAAALAVAVWLSWQGTQPIERVGDVPYVPTRPVVLEAMLRLAEVGSEDILYDLGSGDGRIVIGAAQRYGARGRGIELDAELVAESRRNAAAAGVEGLAEFATGDLFDSDFSEATVVTLYLLPTVNLALRPKLFTDLAPGTRVVSQSFHMAEWQPDAMLAVDADPPTELYRWVIPAAAGGIWEGSDPGSPTLRLVQAFQQVEGELEWRDETVQVLGTITGRRLRINANRAFSGDAAPLRIEAELDGDRIVGRWQPVEDSSDGGAELQLRRRGVDLGGVWEVGALHDDFVAEWLLGIDREGPGWTATRRTLDTVARELAAPGLPGAPRVVSEPLQDLERRMSDFYVWGSSIYFVVGGGEGEAARVAYRGLVSDDTIRGIVQNGADTLPWTARRRGGR